MNCHCSSLNLSVRAALLLAVAAAWPVHAQESIIFSRPTDNVTEKANSFMEQQPHKMPGAFNAPKPLFGGKPQADFDVLPGYQKPTAQPLTAEQIRQMQQNFDLQRNWTLMTPAEILGVPTVEKILGIPDPNEKLTVEERYYKRQEQQRGFSATNALRRTENFAAGDEGPFATARTGRNSELAGDARNQFDQALKEAELTPLQAEQLKRRAESPWGNGFDTPVPSKADKEQQAAMERFRAMMEPPPQPEKPVVTANASTPPSRPVDPNMQALPAFNPAGNTFTAVRDSASRPIGITPLPPVSARPPVVTAKPKPLVEAPPWAKDEKKSSKSSKPPETFLQRKF